MVRRLLPVSLFAICALNGTMVFANTENDQEASPAQSAHFGTAVYSLYTDDPLTSLSTLSLAKHKGVSVSQHEILDLLEGGIALTYNMPALAQKHLNDETLGGNNEPLALYWLARLNFSQGLYEQGLQSYNQLVDATSNSDIQQLFTPAQWYALNYQGAQASLAMGESDVTDFKAAIPKHHITQQYLHYNEGVLAHLSGNTSDALGLFTQVEQSLAVNLSAESRIERFFDWAKWWQMPEDSSVTAAEREALLNQVYLTQGQLHLSLGKLPEALAALSKLDPNDVQLAHRHDELLLNYAWGLAQADDWPNAMGIWSYLSSQPINMFTLQATHALAVGYSAQQGEVQAFETLTQLNQNIAAAMEELDNLLSLVERDGYWQGVTNNIQSLNSESAVETAIADITWPNAHHDIFIDLLGGSDDGRSQSNRFSDLASLYAIRSQLLEQQQDIATYQQLLDERDSVHTRRVSKSSDGYLQHQITSLEHEYDVLVSTVNRASDDVATAENIDELLAGLATFADEQQGDWLARLVKAQTTKTHIAQQRELRPTYTTRLNRLMGILLWELHEQYPRAQWEAEAHLNTLESLLEQANQQHSSYMALLGETQVTHNERERLGSIEQAFLLHLTTTESLIGALETALREEVHTAIADRKDYLTQQYNVNRLAMIQLQDSHSERVQ